MLRKACSNMSPASSAPVTRWKAAPRLPLPRGGRVKTVKRNFRSGTWMCPPPKVASGKRKPRFSLVACDARDRESEATHRR